MAVESDLLLPFLAGTALVLAVAHTLGILTSTIYAVIVLVVRSTRWATPRNGTSRSSTEALRPTCRSVFKTIFPVRRCSSRCGSDRIRRLAGS